MATATKASNGCSTVMAKLDAVEGKDGKSQEPPMPAEKFDFRNAQGHTLAALLDRPDGPIRAVGLFAHCFTCGKSNRAARHIAEGLKLHGIAVLRFDFTGLGASEGEFANTTFSSNVDDLVAAARSEE